MPVNPPDKGLLLSSRVDFTIPSPFAREHRITLSNTDATSACPAMLKRLTKQIDGAVVTAWDGVHAEVTSKAIAAGKPVFCEKPLTTTKADCAEIVRNEQAAGRNLVQISFMRRYDPDYCKIKAILDYGELGKPLMAHCISRTPRIAAGFTNAMQVTNVLIQEIDQFRWLFGEELVRGQMLAARNTKFAADGLNDPQLALM